MRINADAKPDEILISDATRRVMGRAEGFDFDDAHDFPINVFNGVHRLRGLRL